MKRIFSPVTAFACVSLFSPPLFLSCSKKDSQAIKKNETNTSAPLNLDDTKKMQTEIFESRSVSGSFSLSIDFNHESLKSETLEPKSAPVQLIPNVNSETQAIHAQAFVKPVPQRPEILRLEIILENTYQDVSLMDLELQLESGRLIDTSNDPFATEEVLPNSRIAFGGLAKQGMGRIILAVPKPLQSLDGSADTSVQNLKMKISGKTSLFEARTSNIMASTQDGSELWAIVPDSRIVAIVDTATDSKKAEVTLAAVASGLDITPDNKFIFVTAAATNELYVIERKTRKIVQTLREENGAWRDLRTIVVSPQGDYVYVGGYVSDTLTKLRIRSNADSNTDSNPPASVLEIAGEIKIGRRPTHMSVTPDGKSLLVGHFLPRGKIYENEAWVSVVSTDEMKLQKEIRFVDNFNLKESECLRIAYKDRFPDATLKELTTEGVASQIAGAFLEPGGRYAWAPGTRIPGGPPVFEIGPNHKELSGTYFFGKKGALVGSFGFMIDTRQTASRIPENFSETLSHEVLDMDDVLYEQLKCGKYTQESELVPAQFIDANTHLTSQANLPSALSGVDEASPIRYLGFTKGGRRTLKLAYAADVIVTEDAVTLNPTARQHLLLSGSNPQGLYVLPHGNKAYVSYRNSMKLSVLDLSDFSDLSESSQETAAEDILEKQLPTPFYLPYKWNNDPKYRRGGGFLTRKRLQRDLSLLENQPQVRESGSVQLIEVDPLTSERRRGHILFDSSSPIKYPQLTESSGGSCGGCHPDGATDGSMWTTMEGERRTMALYGGVRDRGWLHASATHLDSKEFASIIVSDRLGGKLSEADTAALAKYVADGIPKLQAPPTDPLKVALGAELFNKNCSACHTGPTFTSGNPDKGNEFGGGSYTSGPGLFDVGTASDFSYAGTPLIFERFRTELPESRALEMLRGDRELGSNDFVQDYFDFTPRPDRARGMFKSPALTNVWHNVVFFHDARFNTLEEVVSYFNEYLSLNLKSNEQEAVVEYLKTL